MNVLKYAVMAFMLALCFASLVYLPLVPWPDSEAVAILAVFSMLAGIMAGRMEF